MGDFVAGTARRKLENGMIKFQRRLKPLVCGDKRREGWQSVRIANEYGPMCLPSPPTYTSP